MKEPSPLSCQNRFWTSINIHVCHRSFKASNMARGCGTNATRLLALLTVFTSKPRLGERKLLLSWTTLLRPLFLCVCQPSKTTSGEIRCLRVAPSAWAECHGALIRPTDPLSPAMHTTRPRVMSEAHRTLNQGQLPSIKLNPGTNLKALATDQPY